MILAPLAWLAAQAHLIPIDRRHPERKDFTYRQVGAVLAPGTALYSTLLLLVAQPQESFENRCCRTISWNSAGDTGLPNR